MNRNNVIDFIFRADKADLDNIIQAAQLRRSQLASQTRVMLSVGDTVKFTSAKKRSPYTYTGVITAKRQSRATVRITAPSFGKYAVGSLVTVPFAMLTEA
jgi:hypothetical protein